MQRLFVIILLVVNCSVTVATAGFSPEMPFDSTGGGAGSGLPGFNGGRLLTAELNVARPSSGMNAVVIRMTPTVEWLFAEAVTIALTDPVGNVIASTEMAPPVSGERGYWLVTFRSPANPYSAYGGAPSTLADLSFLGVVGDAATVYIWSEPGIPAEVTSLPHVTIFGGTQSLEFLIYSRAPQPLTIQNLQIVPEPDTLILVGVGTLMLMSAHTQRGRRTTQGFAPTRT
jgi:hypothetical protein